MIAPPFDETRRPLLDVSNLKTWFRGNRGEVRAVDGVSFSVSPGEVLGIVGESGSGKSATGFSIIGLIDEPGRIVEGSIKLEGRELIGLPQEELRRIRGKTISMVFQDPMVALNPVLSIGTQIRLGLEAHERIGPKEARERAIVALARMRIRQPEQKVDFFPHQFSGGMRQRVAIAIALLHRPKLVICDEPTTALDVSIQAEILSEMKAQVSDLGTALIWISHDLATVASIADRVAVMRSGHIVESGPALAVLTKPQHDYTKTLLNALPSRASPGQLLTRRAGVPDAAPPARKVASGEVLALGSPYLVISDAIKTFAKPANLFARLQFRLAGSNPPSTPNAVDGVDIVLNRGEVLGLVGESGSGKSTLGRMAAGIMAPTSGSVRLAGQPVMSSGTMPRKITTRVQTIFQDPFASLNGRMRIGETLSEGPLAHRLISRGEAADYVRQWLAAVGLDPAYANRFPHQFSGGQRQRIAIARALAMQPDIVVCDEPVASLDVSIQAQIINLLIRLRSELDLSLIFISHDLSIVRHLCDRVAIMHRGRIVEEGAAEAIYARPQNDYTKRLLAAVPMLPRMIE
ncbi:dipeptide ABC transporter ATP-binding protein [Bradyrhizobium sp. UFLA05-112]